VTTCQFGRLRGSYKGVTCVNNIRIFIFSTKMNLQPQLKPLNVAVFFYERIFVDYRRKRLGYRRFRVDYERKRLFYRRFFVVYQRKRLFYRRFFVVYQRFRVDYRRFNKNGDIQFLWMSLTNQVFSFGAFY